MKFSASISFCLGAALLVNVSVAEQPSGTPAQQRIAAAARQTASDPNNAEAYNALALAYLSRARETAAPDAVPSGNVASEYDRRAAEALATGFRLAPTDYQLRKTQVLLLLDQHQFQAAQQQARDLSLHTPDDAAVHGYLARADLGLGDYQGAEASAQWSLNLLPFNVPALLIAADIRNHYGDQEGALELLRRASGETSPAETAELASIDNRIASIQIESSQFDAARQTLQQADELFPGFPETSRTRAGLRPVQQPPAPSVTGGLTSTTATLANPQPDLRAAQAHPSRPAGMVKVILAPVPAALLLPRPTGTERILHNLQTRAQANPKDPAAYTALGAAFFQRARETGDVEDFQQAEQALNKSLALNSVDFSAAAAYSAIAEVCMGEHRFSDAIQYAEKALALGSGDLSPFAIVGDANADMGDYERAAVAYSRLDISNESAAQPRTIYVRDSRTSYLKFIAGDTPGAIRLMQSAVTAGTEARLPAENLAWLSYELGEYETQAGDIAAANNAYLAALTIHPGDYRALAALAKLRANQGRYAEAIQLYQSAIAVVPMPLFVAELGDLYTKAGKPAQASKQYQLVQYIGLLGHINQVLHNRDLAIFYADHDIKLDQSLALARKEFEVRHDVYTWDALAWALYKNGKYQEASEAMENALRPGTQDALVLFHAGMIAGRSGQTTQARQRLEQALAINPQFHVIDADLARQQLQALQAQPGLTASQGPNHVP